MIATLNQVADGWWELLSVMTLQSSLFLVVTLGLLYRWRAQAATTLQLIAVLALVKLYIPPVLFGDRTPELVREPVARVTRVAFAHAGTAGAELQLSARSWIMVAWLGVACVLLLLMLWRSHRLRRQIGEARPVSPRELAPCLIPPSVRVVEWDRASSPFVLGLFAPRIVLPPCWREWPHSTLATVLAHECGHLRRGDLILQLLQRVALALHWFNPLVWLLQRRLDLLRELACDDHTIRRVGMTAQNYARDLLRVAEDVGRTPRSAIAAVGESSLRSRFRYLLREARSPRLAWGGRLALLGFALALIPFSWNVLGSVERLVERALPVPVDGYASLGRMLECPCSMTVHGEYCGQGEILVATQLPSESKHGELRFALTVRADGSLDELDVLQEAPDCLPWSPAPMIDALRGASWQPAVVAGRSVERRIEIAFRPGNFES